MTAPGYSESSADGSTEREAPQAPGLAPGGRPVSEVPLPLPGLVRCIECGGLCNGAAPFGPVRQLCSARCRKRRSRRLAHGRQLHRTHPDVVPQEPAPLVTPLTMSQVDDVAALLRDARVDAGMTQSELASRLGISRGKVAHIERGRRMAVQLLPWLNACGWAICAVRRSP